MLLQPLLLFHLVHQRGLFHCSNSFGTKQNNSLNDYIEASVFLQYKIIIVKNIVILSIILRIIGTYW